MSFQSLHFLLFVIAVFTANRFLLDRTNARKNMLLLASYYFYMCWDWRFSALLALVAGVNYLAAIRIEQSSAPRQRKLWLTFALLCCLGILACFKYTNFFISNVESLLRSLGLEANLPLLNLLLPIGISFFTFQGISYTIDVYRKQQSAVRDFRDLALFVAFFPTVLSGPITRGRQLLPQFANPMPYTEAHSQEGLFLVLRGLVKKIVFADVMAVHLVNPAFAAPELYSPLFLIVAVYAYTFQIYMDLSGYTDIARGIAKILGFDLPENFNRPYQATSVSNFWQRWHMSMSGFFRDYLYFGFGGSKSGNTYINILITFVAIGLWHGADWSFIVYGFLHGSMVCIERFFRNRKEAWGLDRLFRQPAYTLFAVVATLHFVAFSRILFRSADFDKAGHFVAAIMGSSGQITPFGWLGMSVLALSVVLHYTPRDWSGFAARQLARIPAVAQGAVIASVFLGLIALSSGGASFVYFQF